MHPASRPSPWDSDCLIHELLPVELIDAVLEYVTWESRDALRIPTRVCTLWRDVVYASPVWRLRAAHNEHPTRSFFNTHIMLETESALRWKRPVNRFAFVVTVPYDPLESAALLDTLPGRISSLVLCVTSATLSKLYESPGFRGDYWLANRLTRVHTLILESDPDDCWSSMLLTLATMPRAHFESTPTPTFLCDSTAGGGGGAEPAVSTYLELVNISFRYDKLLSGATLRSCQRISIIDCGSLRDVSGLSDIPEVILVACPQITPRSVAALTGVRFLRLESIDLERETLLTLLTTSNVLRSLSVTSCQNADAAFAALGTAALEFDGGGVLVDANTSLHELRIQDVNNLSSVSWIPRLTPNLRVLAVSNAPDLRSVPAVAGIIERLSLYRCGIGSLRSLASCTYSNIVELHLTRRNEVDLSALAELAALRRLHLTGVRPPVGESVHLGLLLAGVAPLDMLTLKHCAGRVLPVVATEMVFMPMSFVRRVEDQPLNENKTEMTPAASEFINIVTAFGASGVQTLTVGSLCGYDLYGILSYNLNGEHFKNIPRVHIKRGADMVNTAALGSGCVSWLSLESGCFGFNLNPFGALAAGLQTIRYLDLSNNDRLKNVAVLGSGCVEHLLLDHCADVTSAAGLQTIRVLSMRGSGVEDVSNVFTEGSVVEELDVRACLYLSAAYLRAEQAGPFARQCVRYTDVPDEAQRNRHGVIPSKSFHGLCWALLEGFCGSLWINVETEDVAEDDERNMRAQDRRYLIP